MNIDISLIVIVAVVVVVTVGAVLLVRGGKTNDSQIKSRTGGHGKQRTKP